MKRLYKKSLYKIFVSLFLVFYTLIPQSIAMGQVIDEYSQNNAAPAEEEVIPEESLPQKEVVLPEEIPPVVEEPLVEEMPIEEPVVEVPVVEQPIVEPKEVIKEVMSYPVWVIKGNTATTSDIVELGKTYISPQNSRVRIIFTKLPENPSTISIEEITLTQAEIEVTGAVSDKAYDIKTDMLDGTFEYDLVLPSIEEKTKVVYVEERKDIFTDVKEVNNELVNEKDIVKIEDVDHFTIFIVTGIWPTTSNDSIVSGEGTSQIRWPSGSSNQSGLGFVGVSGLDLESLTTSGDSFILGTLTHYNHPVQSSIVWSDLKITLGLPTPKDFTFRVQIDETPNTQNLSGCTSGFQLTTTPCDDKVTFPDSISDQIVTVGGIDYTLIIDGFKRTLSGTTLDSFVTEENKDNTASLVGHFVPVGRIIVDKITDPIADITSFSFTTTGAGYGAFSLSDTSTPNNQVLPANKTYSVGETLPANWVQSSVNCVSSIGDTETSTAMELDAGETITCTFTNTSTLCRAGNPSLEGKIKNGSYTTGNLCAGNGDCWSEGEDVPARITIPGMVIGKNYSVSIQHDYSLSGTIGYEYFHTALSGNGSANNISLGSATTTDCGGGVTCKDYVLSFTAQSTTVQLDWLARLSNQAGNWSGASLHYRLTVGPCGGSGNKDIPINPGKIIKLGSINVIKSTNNNAIPSEWSFNITGNTNVGNIPSGSTANNLSLGSNNGDATYTITEVGPNSDWYLDSVSGDCTKSGNNTASVVLTSSKPDVSCTFVNIKYNPLIEVVKESTTASITSAGQVVPYTFTVKNKGNQTLTEIIVTDVKCDSAPSYVSGDTNTDSKLQVSETWVYGCNHTVTQGEIDLGGKLSNTVTADSKESVLDTDTKEIPITQSRSLSIVKTATPSTYSAVGNVISYSFKVTNNGNVTLSGPFTVSDDKASDESCPATASLAPGASITCIASYTINQADLDGGSVTNIASASNGTVTSPTDTETVTSIAGKIIIQKQTLPDGSVQSFEFNPSWSTEDFELKDGEQKDSGWLVPGRYVISEILPNGWYLNNTSCISSKEDTETVDSISLDNNEIVTCTFTNYQKGSITVTKVDNINSGQDFTFNFTPLRLTSSQFMLDDDNNTDGTLSDTRTFTGLVSTFYDISEVAIPGWTSGIVSCISDNPMQHPQNSYWYGTISVALRPGENMICTFTNTRDTGSIKVNKYTDINGDGDWYDYNEKNNPNANTLGFRWSLDSAGSNNMGVQVANVVTGSHSVDEIMPAGYHFVSWYINGTGKSCSNPNGRTLPITLDITKDNTKEITICNARDTGTVTIIKDAINNSEEDFYFDTNFPSGDFELEDDGHIGNGGTPEKRTFTIPTGSYWIDERNEYGWKLTNLECIGDDSSAINLLDGKVDIDLDYGENITCTYTNTHLAKVWGFKYNDENGNGDWNLGEWGLGNWRIFIDEGNGIYDGTEQSSLTSNHLLSLGYYEFENLLPGEYTLCEQLQTGWTNTTPFCQTINLTPGEEERFVNFANIKYGSILAHKFEDTNGDGDIDENENGLEGWQMNVYKGFGCTGDVISEYTNNSGNAQFDNVVAGHYSVRETDQEGWVTTTPECQNIHVIPGQTTLVNIGNVILTDIHGFKWSDFNGNGERDCIGNGGSIEIARGTCELEPLLSDWTINLFKWNGDGYESEPFKTMDTNNSEEEYGWYWFEDLLPGKYKICEVQQDGWTQTYPINEIGNCHEITLPLESDSINTLVSLNYVAGPQYDFGNTIDPKLEIQKSNDTGGAGMIAGDTVVFTIKILAPEIIEDGGIYQIKDVKVRDIMPSGFKYQGGSWTAISSIRGDLKASLVTVDPIYAVDNAGNWLLGDMVEGEVITLTYTTKISLLQDPGLYKDLAWTSGESVLGASVYGNSDSGIFVGTEVLVVEPEGIEEGEVLGASIELPRTGAQTYLTLGALISMILGFILLVFNPKKKIGKLIIAGVLLLGVFGFIKPTPMYASTPNINVQIEQPESPTKKSSFNIGFVALDLLDRDLSVQCYKDGDIPFNPVYNGNNGNCVVDSSIISASGTYHFYVKASAGTESRNSDVVTVVVDLEKPLPVTNYVKIEGTCTYTLTFKTANDGRTSKVEIFRSSTQPFTANASTLIDTKTVGPNTDVSYTDTSITDCSKEYYYAIRALDDLGNFSSFVTDNIVKIVTVPGTTATTVTVNGETGEVAGEETTAGEETKGEDGTNEEEVDNNGEVKGEEEENTEDGDGDEKDQSFWNKYKYILIACIVVGLGSAGYSYVRRKK